VNRGFLRTATPLTSDLTLISEITMELALIGGMVLALSRTRQVSIRRDSTQPDPHHVSDGDLSLALIRPACSCWPPQSLLGTLSRARCPGDCCRAAPAIYLAGCRDYDPSHRFGLLNTRNNANGPCDMVVGAALGNGNVCWVVRLAVVVQKTPRDCERGPMETLFRNEDPHSPRRQDPFPILGRFGSVPRFRAGEADITHALSI
jgi:hypothetical protein